MVISRRQKLPVARIELIPNSVITSVLLLNPHGLQGLLEFHKFYLAKREQSFWKISHLDEPVTKIHTYLSWKPITLDLLPKMSSSRDGVYLKEKTGQIV